MADRRTSPEETNGRSSSPAHSPPVNGPKPKTGHIYVAIYKISGDNDETQTNEYQQRHPHQHQNQIRVHRWAILVEPGRNRSVNFGLPHHHNAAETGPVIFSIAPDETFSSWRYHAHHSTAADEEALIGKIRIAEAKQGASTTARVEEVVRGRPLLHNQQPQQPKSPKSPHSGAINTADPPPTERSSEHWVRNSVIALQCAALVENFDLDEFMTFARGYVMERLSIGAEDLAPREIDFHPASFHQHATDASPKKLRHRFSLSSRPRSPAGSSPSRQTEAYA